MCLLPLDIFCWMNDKVFMLWNTVTNLPCLDVRCILVCVNLEYNIREPSDGTRIWNTMSGGQPTGRMRLGA